MKSKFKFKWSYIVYIAALAATIFLTCAISDNIKLKNYLKNDMHYEAWDLVYHNPVSFVLSSSAKDDRIKFFDVMATHKSDNSNSISGDWSLPDFTGWSCAEVACALKNIGQPYEVRFMEAPQMQHNVVVQQEPAFGESVSKDDTVVLYANSAYGRDSTAIYFPIFNKQIGETGEWIIISMGDYIYKCHTDFSDIEVIYDRNIGNQSATINIMTAKNKVYFLKADKNKNDEKKYTLMSISLFNNSIEEIYEFNEYIHFNYYYMGDMYFSVDFAGNFVLDLQTKEYSQTYFRSSSIIYNQNVYWFENILVEDQIYTSKLYINSVDSLNESAEIIQEFDAQICYIMPYNDEVFLGVRQNNGLQIIYSLNLSSQDLNVLSKGGYSPARFNINTKMLIYHNNLYIISSNYYDYKYDLNTMERENIRIVYSHRSKSSTFTIGAKNGGGYFIRSIFPYYNYIYNTMTEKFEKSNVLDEIGRFN